MPRSCSKNHLTYNGLGILGILLQKVLKHQPHRLVNGQTHIAVTQLGFGLPLKLGLLYLRRNNGSQALPAVVSIDAELQFDNRSRLLGKSLQGTGQTSAKARQVRTPIYAIDVVDVGIYILKKGGVVNTRNLNRHLIFLRIDINDVVDQLFTIDVNKLNKLLQPFIGMEFF